MTSKKAVILLSGGLDSGTTLAIANNAGYEIYAITFDYGQRHKFELNSAKKIAKKTGVKSHRIIKLDIAQFGGSALTDSSIEVPKNRPEDSKEIPKTYVPARNTIFLSYALAFAETIYAFDIFIGVNAVDYSGYPDCRLEFIESFQKTANLATAAATEGKGKYTIHTPIIKMTKAEIIAKGIELNFDYSLTHSCYEPDENGISCGRCDACRLRLKGFAQNNLKDPVKYREKQNENY